MNNTFTGSLTYVLSTIKSSFLPALFFACGLITFYAQNPYENGVSLSLHIAFYIFSFLGLLLLCTVNRSKPFFSFLSGVICYVLLNQIKIRYGEDYTLSPEYLWICFVLPLNLVVFYFLSPLKLQSRQSFWLLTAMLMQIVLIQHFGQVITQIPYLEVNFGCLPLEAAALWLLILIPISIDISFKDTLVNTGLFYADSCLFMGLVYSDSATGLTTFFLSFSLILCCTAILDLYRRYNFDVLENVGSYNAYLSQANNKFPYKYTIVLFSIDNRDKLLKVIGDRKLQELEQMLVNRIAAFSYDISVFRYQLADELILVFKNEDAKHTMEYAENIRHVVAASDFIFTNGKEIKITISASVSEKTRLDLNATSVTTRAHNALQKAYRFNCNIVTKA